MTDDADASLNSRHDKKRSPRSEMDGLESLRGEGKGEGESTIRGLTPLITPEKTKKQRQKEKKTNSLRRKLKIIKA